MRRHCVLLFVKFPEPGKVKTRLAATLGPERAATLYRGMAEEVLRRVPPEDEVLVLYDPPERAAEIEAWLRGLSTGRKMVFLAQAAGDLGVRLEVAFTAAFAAGFEAVAAIGSDCVELTAAHFVEAWQALETHDVALGPTIDGGYYLIALRAPRPEIFTGIAWSTDAVFRQTLDRAAAAGLSVHILPTLRDVDTEEDWKRVEC
jgi:uncharacterized protein